MAEYKKDPIDFTYFLLDDDFVSGIMTQESGEKYIKELKKRYPEKSDEIDFAVNLLLDIKGMKTTSQNSRKELVWEKITKRKRKRRIPGLIRIAASVIVLVGISIALFYVGKSGNITDIEKFAAVNETNYNQSRLILSDHQEILISEDDTVISYSTNGAEISVNNSQVISQAVNNDNYNQLIVPSGKYASLQLSDGTRVWVNANSRLIYPPVFRGETREVYLEGEAYFEVKEDLTIPFNVRTDNFRVRVTGTRFNVQSYDKDALYTTLLLEGKVSVSPSAGRNINKKTLETELNPGYIATLESGKREFLLEQVDNPDDYISWKEGYLTFNEKDMAELLERISRYYDIEIELRYMQKPTRISGKLDLKDDPERLLRGLSTIAKCKFKNENGKYIME
jgi:hypothetical protein